jgi:hypothetical protein
MFGFIHSYYHPEGHAVARILNSYDIKFWDFLNDYCWNISGLEPTIEHFISADYTLGEVLWSWETKEKYEEWLVIAGKHWNSALILGEIYSDTVGVTQTHNDPVLDAAPSAGMLAITLDELMLMYGQTVSSPSTL